jgi:hypothetical protein
LKGFPPVIFALPPVAGPFPPNCKIVPPILKGPVTGQKTPENAKKRQKLRFKDETPTG